MTVWLKQSTAVTVKLGPFVDQTDGFTAETGLTITQADVRLSKNGGDMAQKNDATSLTHDEIGMYNCPLNATDTGTLGVLRVMVHESGALPVWQDFMIIAAPVWDSLIGGGDYLQVDAQQISGDLTAAENLEAMFDGTGYAGGTTMLNVNVEAIDGISSRATTLSNVLNESPPLGVNVVQLANSSEGLNGLRAGGQAMVIGNAITGTLTTTAFTTNLSEATNDHYNGRTVTFISGVLAGQMATISDYDGATKKLTVTAMTEAPANLDSFVIL